MTENSLGAHIIRKYNSNDKSIALNEKAELEAIKKELKRLGLRE